MITQSKNELSENAERLEQQKKEAFDLLPLQPSWVITRPRTWFDSGFDAGVLAERERVRNVLDKYTDVDHVVDELFPEEEV